MSSPYQTRAENKILADLKRMRPPVSGMLGPYDLLASVMMATRPELAPMSLDEWIIEHMDVLDDDELTAATAILKLH